MSKFLGRFGAVTAALVIGSGLGCGGGIDKADPEFVDASPDFDGVSLELSGDDGSAADGTSESPLIESESALGEDAPELLPPVRKTVRGINRVVAAFVRKIERIVKENPDVATGTTHTWTRVDGLLEFEFTMTKDAEKKFSFTLGAHLASAPAADFTTILTGDLLKGAAAHRGAGVLHCDLDALHGLDANAYPATGKLDVKFAHVGAVKRIKVKLADYRAEPTAQPSSAAYVYTRLGRGLAGAIKLAINANISDPADATKTAPEWLLIHGRWVRGFVARFDAVAFGGDIPAGTWGRSTECLDATEHAVFKRVVYRHPAVAPGFTVLRDVGSVSACHVSLRAEPSASELPEDEAAARSAADSEDDVEAPADS